MMFWFTFAAICEITFCGNAGTDRIAVKIAAATNRFIKTPVRILKP
jgi:hypothetical protein